jgi:hypothetical protein
MTQLNDEMLRAAAHLVNIIGPWGLVHATINGLLSILPDLIRIANDRLLSPPGHRRR